MLPASLLPASRDAPRAATFTVHLRPDLQPHGAGCSEVSRRPLADLARLVPRVKLDVCNERHCAMGTCWRDWQTPWACVGDRADHA